MAAAVKKLKRTHKKLDFTNPTGAELDVVQAGAPTQIDLCLHVAKAVHHGEVQTLFPNKRPHAVDRLVRKARVPSDEARFE